MTRAAIPPFLLLVGHAGCYASGTGDGGGSADADVGPDIRADDAADTVDCTGVPPCAVDFPCLDESRCEGSDRVITCRDIPCWEICGTPCCFGMACGTEFNFFCPPGMICIESEGDTGPWGRGVRAACTPEAPLDGGTTPDAGSGGSAPSSEADGGEAPAASADGGATAEDADGRRFKESVPVRYEVLYDVDWDVWRIPETFGPCM